MPAAEEDAVPPTGMYSAGTQVSGIQTEQPKMRSRARSLAFRRSRLSVADSYLCSGAAFFHIRAAVMPDRYNTVRYICQLPPLRIPEDMGSTGRNSPSIDSVNHIGFGVVFLSDPCYNEIETSGNELHISVWEDTSWVLSHWAFPFSSSESAF